jgi:hypothetical protein
MRGRRWQRSRRSSVVWVVQIQCTAAPFSKGSGKFRKYSRKIHQRVVRQTQSLFSFQLSQTPCWRLHRSRVVRCSPGPLGMGCDWRRDTRFISIAARRTILKLRSGQNFASSRLSHRVAVRGAVGCRLDRVVADISCGMITLRLGKCLWAAAPARLLRRWCRFHWKQFPECRRVAECVPAFREGQLLPRPPGSKV